MNSQTDFQFWFEVPNGLMRVEGNDGTTIPFSYLGPVRYQRVYDASQFSKVPAGGAFITRIFLRADCGSIGSQISTNLQVNLSTTPKRPNELSAVFAENIGPDETVVWNVAQYISPVGISGFCPKGFINSSDFYPDVPFFYDPAQGNLLLDIRKADTKGTLPVPPKLDAQNVLGDSVSRAVAFSLNTNKAEIVDTVGLVSAFEFFATPTLNVAYENGSLVLSWYWTTQPQTFRVQSSDRVGPGESWSDYPGTIIPSGFLYKLNLAAASLAAPKFFRLFWNTPQPLLGPLVTTPLQVNGVANP